MPGRYEEGTFGDAGASRRVLTTALLVAGGYYVGAWLGFALTLAPVPVSTMWPPNAILLAGLLLTPRRDWFPVLATVFVAHLLIQAQSGVPLAMALSWFVSNCAEATLGVVLVSRLAGTPTFDSARSVTAFIVGAVFLSPLLSSFLDAGLVKLNGWGSATYWEIVRTRVLSNAVASLTLVPFILTAVNALKTGRRASSRSLVEFGVMMAALCAVCWGVFVVQNAHPQAEPSLIYAPIPLLLGAALRFGPLGASASLVICSLISSWGACLGQGPFASQSPALNAFSVQLFTIVMGPPALLLAAVICERESANRDVRSNEAQLAMAIDAARLGRWEWHVDEQRLYWSDTTRRMYEVAPDAPITPATFQALIHPDDRALVDGASVAAARGEDVDVEFRVVLPSGRTRWILSRGRAVFDEQGRPVRIVGVKADITERKAAELEIQGQRRTMSELARVVLAGELSTTLAHEMNQPLAAILANASAARRFLRHEPPALEEVAEIVDAIAHDERRASAIVNRFGALPRRSQSIRVALDVNAMVGQVIAITRGDLILHDVSVETQLERDLPLVIGDAIQLQHVLISLVMNACDALQATAAGDRRVVIATSADEQGFVRVAIRDTGKGVAAGRADTIFEPFVTSEPTRLGLGLSICRSIVESHDGLLRVDATADRGASFSILMPAHDVSSCAGLAQSSRTGA